MNIMKRIVLAIAIFAFVSLSSQAQTAHSLFWRSDSLQVKELFTDQTGQFNKVGHHGPAVENSHMGLRIYFNDSGAIDVYSKSGEKMELLDYLWYPSQELQVSEGAGFDHYIVGKTVGLGGFALWDGSQEIKLKPTKGQSARVGSTKKGSFAEMTVYGVEYNSELVDICIRVDVEKGSRDAYVTATELGGKKVQFLTGVNYHEGQTIFYDEGHIGVWGVHKGDKAPVPIPLGAGLWYNPKHFKAPEKTANMIRVISKPAKSIKTKIVAASTKEKELNTEEKFREYIIQK